MRSLFPSHTIQQASRGFTLLELLVVISLLAILAGFSISAYDGVQDDANYDAAIFEMAEIRNALLQFRRDSGTNDFPGQGIYACTNAINFPSEAGSGSARLDWCNHPANFWMLFINPLDDPSTSSDEEGAWNIDTKRGWNGPYLQRKSGYVDVGAVQSNGTGDPNSGTLTTNLWGVASPFNASPNGNYLVWRNQVGGNDLDKQGTPYLLFDLDDDGSDPTSSDPARLVSLGLGNQYDPPPAPLLSGESDCSQEIADDGYPLDHILCLLR